MNIEINQCKTCDLKYQTVVLKVSSFVDSPVNDKLSLESFFTSHFVNISILKKRLKNLHLKKNLINSPLTTEGTLFLWNW